MDHPISYIIVAFTPSLITKRLQSFKQKYHLYINEPKSNPQYIVLQNESHITFKSAFYLKNTTETQLVNVLSTIQFPPIATSVSTLDVFNSPRFGNVLVTKVDKNEKIQRLHQDIYHIIRPLIIDRNTQTFENDFFTPHISVLYNSSEEILENAKIDVLETLLPFSFTLSGFYLLKSIVGMSGQREIVRAYKTA